jgi:GTPase SAR1 family protein
MAEAQQIPTFKLVLVGDGGTGKVTLESIRMRFLQLWQLIQ